MPGSEHCSQQRRDQERSQGLAEVIHRRQTETDPWSKLTDVRVRRETRVSPEASWVSNRKSRTISAQEHREQGAEDQSARS